jgi:hypothetical protein
MKTTPNKTSFLAVLAGVLAFTIASNNFVLLTFLFATVLFLGQPANSLPSPTLQRIVSIGACWFSPATFIHLWTLPVAPWG